MELNKNNLMDKFLLYLKKKCEIGISICPFSLTATATWKRPVRRGREHGKTIKSNDNDHIATKRMVSISRYIRT